MIPSLMALHASVPAAKEGGPPPRLWADSVPDSIARRCSGSQRGRSHTRVCIPWGNTMVPGCGGGVPGRSDVFRGRGRSTPGIVPGGRRSQHPILKAVSPGGVICAGCRGGVVLGGLRPWAYLLPWGPPRDGDPHGARVVGGPGPPKPYLDQQKEEWGKNWSLGARQIKRLQEFLDRCKEYIAELAEAQASAGERVTTRAHYANWPLVKSSLCASHQSRTQISPPAVTQLVKATMSGLVARHRMTTELSWSRCTGNKNIQSRFVQHKKSKIHEVRQRPFADNRYPPNYVTRTKSPMNIKCTVVLNANGEGLVRTIQMSAGLKDAIVESNGDQTFPAGILDDEREVMDDAAREGAFVSTVATSDGCSTLSSCKVYVTCAYCHLIRQGAGTPHRHRPRVTLELDSTRMFWPDTRPE
ncbi:hypothetical protein EAI_08614 [Harpegnathos saltator]|uniref:Uncharacterized protein n=1 Tax=Harpegnathos saltator TaxID=610380 RepID=E2B4I6_HARSA|nr:hypothetical protein EAI_08614 [Harpegnathos saltator]